MRLFTNDLWSIKGCGGEIMKPNVELIELRKSINPNHSMEVERLKNLEREYSRDLDVEHKKAHPPKPDEIPAGYPPAVPMGLLRYSTEFKQLCDDAPDFVKYCLDPILKVKKTK